MTRSWIKDIKHVYLLGAGGIGMSALGRYFLARGARIYGYDRTPGPTTEALIRLGASIHFEDNPGLIDEVFLKAPPEKRLLIYTPAIPAESQELQFFLKQGIQPVKRSEVLGWIAENSFTIAVAGTHGKTTTTALIAYLLNMAGRRPTAFVGGLIRQLETNFMEGDGSLTVLEADEYDRSFLHLKPALAIVTSAEPDHLDIYGSGEGVRQGFLAFIQNIQPGGTLIIAQQALKDLALKPTNLREDLKVLTYGDQDDSAYLISPKSSHTFSIQGPKNFAAELPLPMPGRHNALNAGAATLTCLELGLDLRQIAEGMTSFPGLHRRLERIIETPDLVFYDDYAHHPTEIEACIASLRELAPGKPLNGIFQPHLYTRTRDFAEGFAAALDKLDTAILMPVYPAREKPIPGVESALLLDLMKNPNRYLAAHPEILPLLERLQPKGVLVTLGAGDIDRLVPKIKQWLIKGKV
jgi:UDP-N-acetylmuramate--alanine ligase